MENSKKNTSSPLTETAVAVVADTDAATVVDTVAQAPRRFPQLCWTQEETLVLIEAYRERWYALRRGYLRTADWDAVAAVVASRCPGASPAKTCAQCRHKMEKLRQRYRAEKQRTISVPYPGGRYFSTWFFFENMDAMENGTDAPAAVQKVENSSGGSQLKSFLDQNVLKLKLKAKCNANSSPDSGYEESIKPKRSNTAIKSQIGYFPFLDAEIHNKFDEEIDRENGIMNSGRRQQPIYRASKPTSNLMSKNYVKMFNNFNFPPVLPKIRKFEQNTYLDDCGHGFSGEIPSNNFSCNLRQKTHGSNRGRDGFEEIIESIKLLTEGFMEIEKAKMEMAREMEAVRIEMETKRNEMLLESQKQMVETFMKGFLEIRKKKKLKSEMLQ